MQTEPLSQVVGPVWLIPPQRSYCLATPPAEALALALTAGTTLEVAAGATTLEVAAATWGLDLVLFLQAVLEDFLEDVAKVVGAAWAWLVTAEVACWTGAAELTTGAAASVVAAAAEEDTSTAAWVAGVVAATAEVVAAAAEETATEEDPELEEPELEPSQTSGPGMG